MNYLGFTRQELARESRFASAIRAGNDDTTRFAHTFTSTVMLVSQPKISTTLTQAVYFPGFGYLLNPASLTVLRTPILARPVVLPVVLEGFARAASRNRRPRNR